MQLNKLLCVGTKFVPQYQKKNMYRLDLVQRSESANFIKFVVNFFYLFFEEGKNNRQYDVACFIDTLKIQLDLHKANAALYVQMDEQTLTVLAQLIDWLAKKNLEEVEAITILARRTEQICNIQIWHNFLKLANSFFEQLKSFLKIQEWERIENVLRNQGLDDYRRVA